MNMDSHPYTWQVSDQHYLNIHELTFQMSESTTNIFGDYLHWRYIGGDSFQSEFGVWGGEDGGLWQKQLFLRNLFKRISEKSEDKNPSNEYVLTCTLTHGRYPAIRSALFQHSWVDFPDERIYCKYFCDYSHWRQFRGVLFPIWIWGMRGRGGKNSSFCVIIELKLLSKQNREDRIDSLSEILSHR